jgi:O-antigen/teichoic acid export membrane protein
MLLASILLVRILGEDDYGAYGFVQNTVTLVSILAGSVLASTAARSIAQLRDTDPWAAGRIVRVLGIVTWGGGLVLVAAVLIAAPWLAADLLGKAALTGPLRIASLLLLLSLAQAGQAGVLSGFEAFRVIASANVLGTVLAFPVMVGGAFFFGVSGAIWGLVFQAGVCVILLQWTLRKSLRPLKTAARTAAGYGEAWRVLFHFSLPLVLAAGVLGIAEWGAPMLLTAREDRLSQLAVFYASRDWFLLLAFLPNLLAQVTLPIASEQLALRNRGECRRVFWYALRINVLTVVPAGVVACLASPLLVRVYGGAFDDHWPTWSIALAAGIVLALVKPAESLLHSAGRMWVSVAMHLGFGLIYYGGAYLAVEWGATGIAAARLVAFVIHCGWLNLYVLRRVLSS